LEKFTRAFGRLKKAYRRFKEVVENPFLPEIFSEEFLIEITTKRFEYTYEALWKTVKEFLRLKCVFKRKQKEVDLKHILRGLECNSPKSCFKEAFKEGLISEEYEDTFFYMILLRNRLAHVYDEEMAREIYLKLKEEKFLKAIESVIKNLENEEV